MKKAEKAAGVYCDVIKISEPYTFTEENTGISEFFNVELRCLNGNRFEVTTSSGAFSFNASSVTANDVELLDMTVRPLNEEVELYVRLSE